MFEVDFPAFIFTLIFSMGIALFHTFILMGMYNLKFPQWLFFVINPLILTITFFLFSSIYFYVFIGLFASVFILGILGFFFSFISGITKTVKEKRKQKTSWLKIIGGLLISVFGIFLFLTLNFYFVFLLILAVIIFQTLTSSKRSFLKYQGILPTSKIRSLAKGLVEIQGFVKSNDYLKSPIKNTTCIAYRYMIQEQRRNKDGKTSYSTIEDRYEATSFSIEDDTGEVNVSTEKLKFHMLKLNAEHHEYGKRYREYILSPNEEVLLVGKATYKTGTTIEIQYEEHKKIFGLAPMEALNFVNKYKPLKNRFFITTGIIAFCIALLLITPLKIEGNRLIIEQPQLFKHLSDIKLTNFFN